MGENSAAAQAVPRTRVRCLPLHMLHDIVGRDAQVGLKLYEATARDLLFTVSQKTAPERLAGFLVALSRRNARRGEDATEIVLPMTRSDIADFLGLTIETVSRTFTKFKIEGLIDLEQCVLVTLKDIGASTRLAGSGYERTVSASTGVAA